MHFEWCEITVTPQARNTHPRWDTGPETIVMDCLYRFLIQVHFLDKFVGLGQAVRRDDY